MNISSIWENSVRMAERVFLKSRIYKRILNFKSSDACDLLADLQNFCGATDLDLKKNKNGDIDALDMARRSGRLEVWQYIAKHLSMTEEQKNVLATRYYQIQQQQKDAFK